MSFSALWEPAVAGRLRLLWPAMAPVFAAIAYYLGAEAAFTIGTLTQQFAPFWPPNVILLCTFLVTPRRYWPVYIAAVFPAHLLAERGVAMPFAQLAAAFSCNVSVALLNAVALRAPLNGYSPLSDLRQTSLYLFFAAIANPGIVAFAAGFEPILGGGDPQQYWTFWWRWYLSNALGNLTLTPVFLTWIADASWASRLTRSRVIETCVLTLGLAISCTIAFDIPLTQATESLFPALLYLPIPLLLAATVRFGGRGATGAILIITVIVLFRSMHGDAPFVAGARGHSVLSVQLFLAVFAIPAILLAALVEELRRTNESLSAVLDGISDAYYTLDRQGQITAINAKGAAWFGYDEPADLIGHSYWDLARERVPDPRWIRSAMQTALPSRGEISLIGGRLVEIHAYPSVSGLSVFCQDITEKRAAEQKARSTQEQLQSSLDALTAQIAILDGTGKIIAANAAWLRTAGLAAQLGAQYTVGINYLAECERGRPRQQEIAAGLRRLLRGEINEFRSEFASDVADGVWLQLRGTRFGVGAARRLVIACEDITEVKAGEASLRRLTSKLLRSEDGTHRRIARELHDSTAQNLLGAALGIGQALRLLPLKKQAARAALEESRSLIEQSQREIRTVSYLLHPPMLDELGLPAALRWFCDGFAKRTDIAVELEMEPDIVRAGEEVELAVFRVAQEALTNVHRHSGATKVQIRLWVDGVSGPVPAMLMEIEDNGDGILADSGYTAGSVKRPANEQSTGVGLAGMRERVQEFGGSLQITSSAQGTIVRASVPLSGSDGAVVGRQASDVH